MQVLRMGLVSVVESVEWCPEAMVRLSLSNFLLLAFLFLTLDGFQAFQFPEKCLIVQQFFRDGSRYVVGSSHRLLSQPRNTPTACVMETIRPRPPAISRVAASCAKGISQVRNNSISAPLRLDPHDRRSRALGTGSRGHHTLTTSLPPRWLYPRLPVRWNEIVPEDDETHLLKSMLHPRYACVLKRGTEMSIGFADQKGHKKSHL